MARDVHLSFSVISRESSSNPDVIHVDVYKKSGYDPGLNFKFESIGCIPGPFVAARLCLKVQWIYSA